MSYSEIISTTLVCVLPRIKNRRGCDYFYLLLGMVVKRKTDVTDRQRFDKPTRLPAETTESGFMVKIRKGPWLPLAEQRAHSNRRHSIVIRTREKLET